MFRCDTNDARTPWFRRRRGREDRSESVNGDFVPPAEPGNRAPETNKIVMKARVAGNALCTYLRNSA